MSDEKLTAHDRCDRCGAQAYVRLTLESGSGLLFCGHHARAGRDRLVELARAGAKLHDELPLIMMKPILEPVSP